VSGRRRDLAAGFVLAAMLASPAVAGDAPKDQIRLLVRGDDIGSSHAANVACIESFQKGVVRTVEVMVPGPWFPEAVVLLRENPGLDVGVHLVLTSEWDGMKWRPLTHGPSLVDDWGYFYPMVWPSEHYPKERAFRESAFRLDEVERELRAQIELAVAHIPQVSHLSAHMGWTGAAPELRALFEKLAKEYGLDIDPSAHGIRPLRAFGEGPATPEEKEARFVAALESLEPGSWMFVDHPARDTPEQRAIGHRGYEDVALDREGVTRAFTSRPVLEAIGKRGVRLISYVDITLQACSEE
jgi:chitin disaccharide deacetylase